jgi:hypothetical protein
MKVKYDSIRDQRESWRLLAHEFVQKALWYRDKAEPENAKRLNDLAKHILAGAAGSDSYEVISIEFRAETAGWLRKKYAFPYEREDGPDLSRERKRLEKMIARGEA